MKPITVYGLVTARLELALAIARRVQLPEEARLTWRDADRWALDAAELAHHLESPELTERAVTIACAILGAVGVLKRHERLEALADGPDDEECIDLDQWYRDERAHEDSVRHL